MGCLLAAALQAELYVVVVRKIGAPGNPELAIGAVSDGSTPHTWLNDSLIEMLRVPEHHIEKAIERQLQELERRKQAYRADQRNPDLKGRTVILTDDGIATGASMRMALEVLRKGDPARCIVAVPVAARESIRELGDEADEIICLQQPEPFMAVGAHYAHFDQVEDAEVIRLLQEFDRRDDKPAHEAMPT
jgi:predicted phosphoribosyltransferase